MPSSVGGQWTDFREPSLSARFPSSSWLSIESPSTLWTEIRWAAKHRVRDDAGLSLLSWDGTRWACTAYAVLTHDSQRGQCATGRAVLNRLSTATGGPMSRGLDTRAPAKSRSAPYVRPCLSLESGSRPGPTQSRGAGPRDRKSTRLNSSHVRISYAVFC